MVKCSHCKKEGHNRRTCPLLVKDQDAAQESHDSDISQFSPDENNDSPISTTTPAPEPAIGRHSLRSASRQKQPRAQPSDNPLNVPATGRVASPILSDSLDKLAENNGLFNDSLSSFEISPIRPAIQSVQQPQIPARRQLFPQRQHPAAFTPREPSPRLPFPPVSL